MTSIKSLNTLFIKFKRLVFAPFYKFFLPLPHPTKAIFTKSLSTDPTNHVQKIRSVSKAVYNPPRINGSISKEYFTLREETPEVFSFELPQGRVFHDGRIILSSGQVLAETLYRPLDRVRNPLKPLANLPGLPPVSHFPGRLAVLAAPMCQRYYHWLLETLPRINFLKEMQPDRFYVYGKQAFIKQSLEFLGIDARQILPQRKYAHWSADKILGVTPLADSGTVTQDTVEFLRSLVTLDRRIESTPRRIYISRDDARYRRVLNEQNLFPLFNRYGIQPVTLSRLSFSEQLNLFASVEVVMAPHGAGLANLVFSPPGCKVIEFMPKNRVNGCFWALSEACGHDYFCLGEVEVSGSHTHLLVDLRQLNDVCSEFLG